MAEHGLLNAVSDTLPASATYVARGNTYVIPTYIMPKYLYTGI
jgi:hypothetical protein